MAPGGTTGDGMFTLEDAECLALCGNAPCLTVNWRFFGDVDLERFDALVDDLRAGRLDDEVPPHGTLNRVRRTVGLPAARAKAATAPGRMWPRRRPRPPPPIRPSTWTPTGPPPRWPPSTPAHLGDGSMTVTDAPRIVSARLGQPRSWTLQSYLADGGYQGLRAALAMTPEEIHDNVNTANILGRGGAGFEAGRKWGMLRKAEPLYLTINGDESEPATFKDHALIEGDPHQLIEGLRDLRLRHRRGPDLPVRPRRVPAGHRTAAGRPQRGLRLRRRRATASSAATSRSTSWSTPVPGPTSAARRRPCSRAWRASGAIPASSLRFSPRPSASTGRPPSSTTWRPLSNLPWVVLNGGDDFAALGEGRSKGTKLMALSGHVKRPGQLRAGMGQGQLPGAHVRSPARRRHPRRQRAEGLHSGRRLLALARTRAPRRAPGQRGHRRGRVHGRLRLGHRHGSHHLHGAGRLAHRRASSTGSRAASAPPAGRAAAGWRRSWSGSRPARAASPTSTC